MNSLPNVVAQRCLEWDLNLGPTDRKPNAIPVAPPRHLNIADYKVLNAMLYTNRVGLKRY